MAGRYSSASDGELQIGPIPAAPPLPVGVTWLQLGMSGDVLVRTPPGAAPAPLLILLHGAGGQPQQALNLVESCPSASGVVLLAPKSRAGTWDLIHGSWGPDVEVIGSAMTAVLAGRSVDQARVAIGGFSDGASYALSLGLANGNLFRAILAFSPGFAMPPRSMGHPRVFVSHGTRDDVLPIEYCSRVIVPRLQQASYEVRYQEFRGGHSVPPGIAEEALAWALSDQHGMDASGNVSN